jgi:hypothetical protein
MTNADVLKKLVGEIKPVGRTEIDLQRFENLQELCFVVEVLLLDIDEVASKYKDSQEYSVKRAADYAKKFLTDKVKIMSI